MDNPFPIPFTWVVALFLIGFLEPIPAAVGRAVVRRATDSFGTTEPGYAIIGAAFIGLVYGVLSGLVETGQSVFGATLELAPLLIAPAEYLFKGAVSGVIISISHTFLDALALAHLPTPRKKDTDQDHSDPPDEP